MASVNKPSQKLDLTDEIQRLGMSYYFEQEIDEVLGKIHEAKQYHISPRLQLRRQPDCKISCGICSSFSPQFIPYSFVPHSILPFSLPLAKKTLSFTSKII